MQANIHTVDPTLDVLSWEECMRLLTELPAMTSERRVQTIRVMLRNPSVEIRQHALRMGSVALSQEEMVSYLREEADDVVRNAGLEMLKLQGIHAFPLAMRLAEDPDEDVVLQALLILDSIRDPRALDTFQRLMHHSNPNIAQAAIVGIGRLGDSRVISELLGFLQKDMWIQMAAVQALGDLRSPAAVPVLHRLLMDPLLAPLALESLARIGGPAAFKVMAADWIQAHERLEAETKLGLLAHVLEGLSRRPIEPAGLRSVLALSLADPSPSIQKLAARCLLSLGQGGEDQPALNALAFEGSSDSLPASLRRRTDLAEFLLAREGILLHWGLWITCYHPRSVPAYALERAFQRLEISSLDPSLLQALAELRHDGLGYALLDLYARTSSEKRSALVPLIRTNRQSIGAHLFQNGKMDKESRLILCALLGGSTDEMLQHIQEMSVPSRCWVLNHMADKKTFMRKLPWRAWLKEHPEDYRRIAVAVAIKTGIPEILRSLNALLAFRPSPDIVAAMGETRYRASVPVLLQLLRTLPSHVESRTFRSLILETLGRIGGEEAYQALKEIVVSGDPDLTKSAFKGLSLCASKEDTTLFRASVTSPDWYIRLACTEVLGKDPSNENLVALARLAADPVAVVAQRAKALIESAGETA